MTRRLRLYGVFGALTAFGPLTTDLYLPGLPRLAHDLGVTTAGAQITFTACVIGLALGQVIAGPISDAWGRRVPLLAGLALFSISSIACAGADSIVVLGGLRLVQGLAGATGIVIARAMVRDRFAGLEAARVFSNLGAVVSAAPILAPLFGSLLLLLGDWRTVFVFLAVFGAGLFAAVVVWTKETLPPRRRRRGGLRDSLRTYGELLREPAFMGYAVPGACSAILLFGFIASSSFVYQDVFGFSPQVFGLLFGLNGICLLSANLVNSRLIGRVAHWRLFETGLAWIAVGGSAVATATLAHGGAAIVVPLVCLTFGGVGLVMANAIGLALGAEAQRARAGSAAGLMGLMQFTAGAAVAPVVGVATSAVPMGLVMAFGGVAALLSYRFINAGSTAATDIVHEMQSPSN